MRTNSQKYVIKCILYDHKIKVIPTFNVKEKQKRKGVNSLTHGKIIAR